MTESMALTPNLASSFARLALSHVEREFPHKLDHVLSGPDDVRGPRALHPIFYGSFDWHSCVHGYWLLAALLRLRPELPHTPETLALFDRQLRPNRVSGEVSYLAGPLRAGFERPYGWAWLLMLTAELARNPLPDAARWSRVLQPLADIFVARLHEHLGKATYPVRVGTHFNSAFALALALEYAAVLRDESLTTLLRNKAIAWYGADRDCQAWEPGGDDFLSPALMEAECMRRVLDPPEFTTWLDGFLPRLAQREPRALFEPAIVTDRTDGKIAHLDGLNLSRAWCWRSLASSWPAHDPRHAAALATAETHLAASLPHITGDYMGEHWLATFALLALVG
ncbi:MAG TPA: DUF2891 domain-containing protein [Gemmatimonadaceae bacterium]|nr:DUF2891 domain-containing protein [Gemmatimonadaceae bacterium]